MFFHYGNCKSKIQELESRNVDLMNQVQELKALYDYQVGVLEKEKQDLAKENHELKQELGARKCVTDSCEEEIKALKREVVNLRKEAHVADFFETITNPKPVSKMSRRQK